MKEINTLYLSSSICMESVGIQPVHALSLALSLAPVVSFVVESMTRHQRSYCSYTVYVMKETDTYSI